MANLNKLKLWYERLDVSTFCRLILLDFVRYLFLRNGRFYFSQGGEDIHCLQLLKGKKNGFYIEVGSNHPVIFSNTFKLYLEGWKGILIDGNPELIELSRRIRKADICLNEIISNQSGEVEFSLTPDSLYSHIRTGRETPDAGSRERILKKRTTTLTEILDHYLEKGQVIDLLSIDTEGHDLAVINSLNLEKYRPSFIVLEDLGLIQHGEADEKIVASLSKWNYILILKDAQNLYFMNKSNK